MLKQVIKKIKKPVMFFVKLYWRVFKPETEGSKIILTNNGDVLLVRHTYGNKLTFPGGGLKRGEDPKDAIKREVKEELGVSISNPEYIKTIVSTLYHKKDKIHVYKLELSTRDIKTDNFEIDEIKWLDLENLPTYLSHSALEIFSVYK